MRPQTDAPKDLGDRRLLVDGSMAMVIDILRKLGREALAERGQSVAVRMNQDAASVNEPQNDRDSSTDVD